MDIEEEKKQKVMDSTVVMSSNNCVMTKDCKFIWKISNFSIRCKKVRDSIVSPIFTVGDAASHKIHWRIKLYPFGDSNESKNFISLYLKCTLSDDIDECDVSLKCDLWNNKEIEPKNKPPSKKFNNKDYMWGYPNFFSRNGEKIKKHLLSSGNDTLSIICYMYDITPHCKNRLMHSVELIRGFDSLFLSENFSDVTIQVDNKKLKAHKNILSARSEVYSAMFKHNTVESNESVINVTDISYDVMKEVLRFFYRGEVENLDLHKKDLLIAADKYDLELLKDCCEEALCKSLSVSNVCEILIIADLHRCDDLKTDTLNFLINNIKAVVDTPEFSQLVRTNTNLSLEIFRSIGDNK